MALPQEHFAGLQETPLCGSCGPWLCRGSFGALCSSVYAFHRDSNVNPAAVLAAVSICSMQHFRRNTRRELGWIRKAVTFGAQNHAVKQSRWLTNQDVCPHSPTPEALRRPATVRCTGSAHSVSRGQVSQHQWFPRVTGHTTGLLPAGNLSWERNSQCKNIHHLPH